MYSYEDRVKAVRLLIQYGGSPTLVIRELGYPSRGMLYNWYNEYFSKNHWGQTYTIDKMWISGRMVKSLLEII